MPVLNHFWIIWSICWGISLKYLKETEPSAKILTLLADAGASEVLICHWMLLVGSWCCWLTKLFPDMGATGCWFAKCDCTLTEPIMFGLGLLSGEDVKEETCNFSIMRRHSKLIFSLPAESEFLVLYGWDLMAKNLKLWWGYHRLCLLPFHLHGLAGVVATPVTERGSLRTANKKSFKKDPCPGKTRNCKHVNNKHPAILVHLFTKQSHLK